ncbi:hypothetical protein PUN28_016488 [Cardiocondyla obscurior]|uniref:Uncharacterized protein n=1 Tax=Cardiocondyla obscurior TaxID=286306 RepID=A0AAW2ESR2_9HYME
MVLQLRMRNRNFCCINDRATRGNVSRGESAYGYKEPVDSNKAKRKREQEINTTKHKEPARSTANPTATTASPYNARYVATRLRDKKLPIRRTLNNKAAILGAGNP